MSNCPEKFEFQCSAAGLGSVGAFLTESFAAKDELKNGKPVV